MSSVRSATHYDADSCQYTVSCAASDTATVRSVAGCPQTWRVTSVTGPAALANVGRDDDGEVGLAHRIARLEESLQHRRRRGCGLRGRGGIGARAVVTPASACGPGPATRCGGPPIRAAAGIAAARTPQTVMVTAVAHTRRRRRSVRERVC